ncbi:hypothetical protein FB45DRAFT_51281 [Roridomyces roridus]|uniref:Uncharacterized protein n=1 Tax=Roridomyces roridus TaxID=1738132 RepID=A0AAD7AYQ3_9AGAR|nr:hypothetical protein FB45DRAFT_51281 [Roridomyces roridus]
MSLVALFAWRPFPYGCLTAFYTILLAAVVSRPSSRRRLFFLPLLAMTWQLLSDAQAGYLSATLWFWSLLTASDYILVTDVQRELRLTGEPAAQSIENAPLIVRFKWAITLLCSSRGIGWAHGPCMRIPTATDTSRWTFITKQIVRFIASQLLFDAVNLHTRCNPALVDRLGLVHVGLAWRVIGTVGWAAGAAAALVGGHAAAAIFSVALGFSRPDEWYPVFGDLADTASLRKFWS